MRWSTPVAVRQVSHGAVLGTLLHGLPATEVVAANGWAILGTAHLLADDADAISADAGRKPRGADLGLQLGLVGDLDEFGATAQQTAQQQSTQENTDRLHADTPLTARQR